jgi:hypothetical protein
MSPRQFGRPDDQKLFLPSRCSAASPAAATTATGLRRPPRSPNCSIAPRPKASLAVQPRNGSSPPMLDPETASVADIDRELVALQRRYHVASHELGERGVRPDGIDDETLAWWVGAHRAKLKRRFERSDIVAVTDQVPQVELRKDRLRKPQRESAASATRRPSSTGAGDDEDGCADEDRRDARPRPRWHRSGRGSVRCSTPHTLRRRRRGWPGG